MNAEISDGLQQQGFIALNDELLVGTWKQYALTIQRFNGRTFFVYLAIRISKQSKELKKVIKEALKSAGVKGASVNRIAPNFLRMTYNFSKKNNLSAFTAFLDLLVSVLGQNAIGPADTCAMTGASNPDSLCLMMDSDYMGYQPVDSNAVQRDGNEIQDIAADNEANGSYLTGTIGAILGTLVGIAVNLCSIIFLERIFAYLFALIPAAAMFGYKQFKGKTNKMSIAIVVVLSLIAVPTIQVLNIAIELAREIDMSFWEALELLIENFTMSEMMELIKEDLGVMVLFTMLGIFIAWNYMSKQLNSTQIQEVQARLDTMRPNPNCQKAQLRAEQAQP